MQAGEDFWDSIFLELARTNSVILIVTHRYQSTAIGITQGGLKREYDEIVRLSEIRPDMKVIPVLREGNWNNLPAEFSTRFAFDLRALVTS
jgi:hypothetical protein